MKTYGKVSWNDKPMLAVSDDGQHVYVAWNGPTGGDPYIAQSHDAGVTWTQTKVVDSTRYYFAFDGDVLPNGTVVFSQSSVSYTGPGSSPEGQVQVHAILSTNQGSQRGPTSWSTRSSWAAPCVATGCSEDYYLGHSGDQRRRERSPRDALRRRHRQPEARRPSGRAGRPTGRDVERSRRLSASGVFSSFPAMESRGTGDVRALYMQQDAGPDAWNVWYRASTDGGVTWSSPVKISDATGGTAYKTASGFREPYGDYGEAAITTTGKLIGVWGEGDSYPGRAGHGSTASCDPIRASFPHAVAIAVVAGAALLAATRRPTPPAAGGARRGPGAPGEDVTLEIADRLAVRERGDHRAGRPHRAGGARARDRMGRGPHRASTEERLGARDRRGPGLAMGLHRGHQVRLSRLPALPRRGDHDRALP